MATLSLAVQYACEEDPLPAGEMPTTAQFRRWIKSALPIDAEVTLRIVGEEEGRMLNRTYRGKDYATNVLTFPLAEEPLLMGDIILCAPVVAREAQAQHKSLQAHFAHLTIHGTLHLQGYEHEIDEQAEFMESMETQILHRLGYPDPYNQEEPSSATINHG
ncbi:MAG TPA: rRNA maturation RNase YbeY [Methylophilaceae bacterium]|nr:rRNA maturation RNase YbeY [Methylophilaceae bacterium]